MCQKGFTMKFRMEQHIQQKHADCVTSGGSGSVESKPNDINAAIKQEDAVAATTVPHGAGLNLPNNNIVPEPQHHHHQNEMVLPKPIEQQHQQNQNGSAAAAMMMLNAGGSNHHHHHLMDQQQQQHHQHQQFMYHANYATSGYAPGQSKMESFDRVFASIR